MNLRTATVHAVIAAFALAIATVSASARTLAPIDAAAALPETAGAAPEANAAATPAGVDRVQLDARHGVPTFLWGAAAVAQSAGPAPKAELDAETAARGHLRELAGTYRTTATEIDALPVANVQRMDNGSALVRFTGAVDGIEVFREGFNVLVARDGALVAIGGFAMGAPASHRKSAQDAPLTAANAAAAALADFGFAADVAARFARSAADGGYERLALPTETVGSDGASLADAARAKRVWFRLADALVPAYYIEVRVRDGQDHRRVDHYAYVVSAADGTLLFRKSQVAHAAYGYRVFAEAQAPYLPLPNPSGRNGFPHPTGTPNGYQGPTVAPNLVTLENLPFSRNDPWLPPGATKTSGNNVEVYADLVAPELLGPVDPNECTLAAPVNGDLHACTSGPNAFDHAVDLAQDPQASRAQIMAGLTHLFYVINWLHDWYYDAGFDEASGNAQTSNYGRGGLANDNIVAVAHDYTDVGNAYMSTPADGQHPEMHNFLWPTEATLSKVLSPAAIAGTKQFGPADFGAQGFDLTAPVVLAQDAADATGPSTTDGCTAFANAPAVAGKLALIDRGTCTFAVKAKNAQNAGAAAVVIANNAPGSLSMTGDDATITIPVISVTLADGAAIKTQLAAAAAVTMRIAQNLGIWRDGALDTLVVSHEWGHYISGRLVGNANGLNAQQAYSLGEGWADFHQMLLLVKDADRSLPGNAGFTGTYASNTYLLGGPDFAPDAVNNAYYYGDRRYPYSRDMTKNPLTFRHIANGAALPPAPPPSFLYSAPDNAEEHNAGEIWGAVLWECYSNLLNDSGRLSFGQAQDRMKRYLVGGYKMTPSDPTFVTARDALLAFVKAQDAQDHDLCLHGFAKRGLGLGAVAPGPFSQTNAGVVESYKSVKPAGGTTRVAVEYYHAGFDHYFVTDIPDEIAKLDNGTFAGWARTEQSFPVYVGLPAGIAGVCRFFSTAFGLKSSHFYTPDPNECVTVKQNGDWQFEATVFGVLAPGPAGDCPAGSNPIYRMYNNGQGGSPNHRYTTSLAIRTQMLAAGWIPEGYGPIGVIMCAPA
ncbi:MAG: M36 family metallopeptidase [Burkholderiales bacterium]|nr:M36 family metallopeptidase [Burkholderiales bacterium]